MSFELQLWVTAVKDKSSHSFCTELYSDVLCLFFIFFNLYFIGKSFEINKRDNTVQYTDPPCVDSRMCLPSLYLTSSVLSKAVTSC